MNKTQKQNNKLKTINCRSLLTIKINKNLQQNIIKSLLPKSLIVIENLHVEAEGVIFRGCVSYRTPTYMCKILKFFPTKHYEIQPITSTT